MNDIITIQQESALKSELLILDFMREHKLVSFNHMVVLIYLCEHKTATQSELAKLLKITPAGMTGLVDSLVIAGLVESNRSESDRRSVVSTPTQITLDFWKSYVNSKAKHTLEG